MMKDFYKVTNKSTGPVVFTTAEYGRRVFSPRQDMELSVKELHQLAQTPGGEELIYNYLYIDDKEALSFLLGRKTIENEYWIKEEDMANWMLKSTLAEFQDALDFAPKGTIDLIKKYAIAMPLNDYAKRRAMVEQLGFNIDEAIKIDQEEKAEKPAAAEKSRRVVVTPEEDSTPKRRVVIPED